MKKAALYTILALCFMMLAGCKREEKVISAEDVKSNTVLVRNNGTVQSATVEAFDKDYYSLSGLSDFITQEITKYNGDAGEEAITLSNLDQKEGNAVLILNYTNLSHYSQFNQTETVLTSVQAAQNGDIALPDTFINAKNNETVSKDEILKNEKYKILVVHEMTDVMVDGSVKYYSGGTLADKSRVQTSEGETFIVYKP